MGDRDYVTSRDYEHPYRPLPIRLYNFLGRAGRKLGLPDDLKAEVLVDRARRKTGTDGFR